MSILGSIVSKILGHHGPAGTDQAATGTLHIPPPVSTGSNTAPPAPAAPPMAGAPRPSDPAASTSSEPAGTIDVAGMLDALAAKAGQTLDWRHSIVDMMKLIGLDSALSARQALAKELHYTGDIHDSATMNIWLHKQVMAKLADNGGKVPDDLKA